MRGATADSSLSDRIRRNADILLTYGDPGFLSSSFSLSLHKLPLPPFTDVSHMSTLVGTMPVIFAAPIVIAAVAVTGVVAAPAAAIVAAESDVYVDQNRRNKTLSEQVQDPSAHRPIEDAVIWQRCCQPRLHFTYLPTALSHSRHIFPISLALLRPLHPSHFRQT